MLIKLISQIIFASSLRALTHREYDLTSLLEIFLNVFNLNLSILKEKNLI